MENSHESHASIVFSSFLHAPSLILTKSTPVEMLEVKVAQLYLTLCDPMDYNWRIYSPKFSRREYWSE